MREATYTPTGQPGELALRCYGTYSKVTVKRTPLTALVHAEPREKEFNPNLFFLDVSGRRSAALTEADARAAAARIVKAVDRILNEYAEEPIYLPGRKRRRGKSA